MVTGKIGKAGKHELRWQSAKGSPYPHLDRATINKVLQHRGSIARHYTKRSAGSSFDG